MKDLFTPPIFRFRPEQYTKRTPRRTPNRPHILNAYFYQARRRMRLSKMDLARLTGVDPKTIYNIEKGLVEPKVFLAVKIAKVLGVSVEDIFVIEQY